MTAIRIEGVRKHYGTAAAVDGVSLTIHAGDLFFLLGPSGCGKTTLLRILAGFVEPDGGDVFFDDQSMKGVPPRLRNTGMVFQSYALWPHRTVAGNVSYGLEVRGFSRREIDTQVAAALKLVRLEGLADRRPTQLSGGQQQRVALARALVIQPRVLLLDEPLSNLDARLRLEMRDEIRRIHDATGLTMVYVTHDQKEALSLASRIAVMHRGRLVQVGTPAEVYQTPASRFVADFMGDCNFITGTVEALLPDRRCQVETALGALIGTCSEQLPQIGQSVTCSIRPEMLRADPTATVNRLSATVDRCSFLGEMVHVTLKAGSLSLLVLSLQDGRHAWKPGATVVVSAPPEGVTVLTS